MIQPIIMKTQPRTMHGLRPYRSVIVGLDFSISHAPVASYARKNLHGEHGEDGADGKHVGQEAEETGLRRVRSNVIKVTLPEVVLLQEIEKRSGEKQVQHKP